MKSWVEENLLTAKKDKLSAKRINEKWFLARGFSYEYNSLIAINPDLTLACKHRSTSGNIPRPLECWL